MNHAKVVVFNYQYLLDPKVATILFYFTSFFFYILIYLTAVSQEKSRHRTNISRPNHSGHSNHSDHPNHFKICISQGRGDGLEGAGERVGRDLR